MDANTPLAYLGGLSATEFLRDYWQKKPLLVRNAFPELAYRLSPEDLMELAQEESAESRLILEKGKTPWELRKGPFTPKQFKALPKTHWTLLVQAVDHYLPELSDYLDHFSFIPNWRIDDIMISFAPEGGSVGPHYDQYDVFLIQGIGNRRWQLGQHCDETTPRVQGTPLRIIENIEVGFDEVLGPGDLLYVPPGLSHYGVAQNDCTTYSVGFRAPALAHLLERVVDVALENAGSTQLFADTAREATQHPGELTDKDLEALRQQLMSLLDNREALRAAVAPFLSEAKYEDYEPQGEEFDVEEVREAFTAGALLRRDPASRCLYTVQDDSPALFINGQEVDFPAGITDFVLLLANHRQLAAAELKDWLEHGEALPWLVEQLAVGYWFLDSIE
ncbi:MAG: cupin domain-containing protein [Pedobacter sp.]|nr:cupin domain-containing protein [Pedobacter sp.]